MNEEIQKMVLSLLQEGKDFVVGQAPDAIQQYIAIEAVSAFARALTCGVALLGLLSLFAWQIRMYRRRDKSRDMWSGESYFFAMGLVGVLGVIAFVLTLCSATENYKITHYPKGYLLQQATKKGCSQ